MAKVLWMSDGGVATGFGRATHAIGERLVEDYGHTVWVLAVNFDGDAHDCERVGHDHPTPLRLYKPDVYMSMDIWGRSRVIEMLGKLEPDVVVMLQDPQIVLETLLNNKYDPEKILLRYRPIIYYAPIDGTGLPARWTTILPKITNVVAMSRHGQSMFEGSKLVYHAADRDRFWPIWERPKTTSTGIVCRTKTECKKAFGLDPSGFLVGRIDTNSGRKDYPATVKALWPLMERYHEMDAWFHCSDDGPSVGVRFQAMFSRNEKVPTSRFHFPGLHTARAGWPIEDLNVLYSAFDVFVSTSRGEGYGLTLAEAAACGIPIVAQNVSAIPEVVGPGGILIEPQRLLTVPGGHDNWLPDIDAFTGAIERLYRSSGLRRDLGEAGAAHIATHSWDIAAQKFDEYVTALAAYEPPVATEASESADAVRI